jgi:hypothetical protein
MDIPVSAIGTLEISLGQERSFGKYYGIALGVSTVVGGIVGFTKASSGVGSSRSSSYFRGRSTGGGLLVGYMVGVPLGVFMGSRMREETWNPVAIPGPAQSGPTIRPVIGSELGLSAGQRIRVRAAGALSVEGVFGGLEGQDMLLSTPQAGQDQRVPIDRLQALWVRKRATKEGAVIGAITGAVFGIGVAFYVDKYVGTDCRSCEPDPLEVGLVLGASGAGAGAVVGAAIGFLVQRWSPVWP